MGVCGGDPDGLGAFEGSKEGDVAVIVEDGIAQGGEVPDQARGSALIWSAALSIRSCAGHFSYGPVAFARVYGDDGGVGGGSLGVDDLPFAIGRRCDHCGFEGDVAQVVDGRVAEGVEFD